MPGLGAEPWEVQEHPSGATATLLAGLALSELGHVTNDETTTLDDSHRLLPDLGRIPVVVEKVTAVQRKHLPVRERWIETVRDEEQSDSGSACATTRESCWVNKQAA